MYFFSHEPNEPPRVNVDRDNLSAKFWLRIFDNIDGSLLPALRETLQASGDTESSQLREAVEAARETLVALQRNRLTTTVVRS